MQREKLYNLLSKGYCNRFGEKQKVHVEIGFCIQNVELFTRHHLLLRVGILR